MVKAKLSRCRPGFAQKLSGGIDHYSSMTAALEGGECSAARSDRTLHPENPGTYCTGGWVVPRVGVDGLKISPPPGFHPVPFSQ